MAREGTDVKVHLKASQVMRWRKQNFDPALIKNIQRAVDFVKKEVVRAIDKPYPPASSPGEPPRKRTGAYQESIVGVVHPSRTGKSIVGRVGSDDSHPASVYSRRLEFGFVGTDSLGRNYNQAPRPHLRAVMAEHDVKVGKMIAGGR